jgi:hypothetical protein
MGREFGLRLCGDLDNWNVLVGERIPPAPAQRY